MELFDKKFKHFKQVRQSHMIQICMTASTETWNKCDNKYNNNKYDT